MIELLRPDAADDAEDRQHQRRRDRVEQHEEEVMDLERHEDVHRRRRGQPDQQTAGRSEEHTSELQSLMRISYAVFCLKKKKQTLNTTTAQDTTTHQPSQL